MPSKNRIEAGRRNGALAKGKKSEESRQKCATNSLRHGLTAKLIVLSHESKSDFEHLRKAYYDRFQPADEVECDAVDDMVAARWRLRRTWSIEKTTLQCRQDRMQDIPSQDREYIGEPPDDLRLMLAFEKEANDSDTLRLCTRYETRLYRNIERAEAGLRRLQKERIEQEESIPPIEGNAGAESTPKPATPARKIVEMPRHNPELRPKSTPDEPISPVTPHRE